MRIIRLRACLSCFNLVGFVSETEPCRAKLQKRKMIENNKVSDKSGAQPKEPTKDPHMLRSSKALDVQEVITFTDLRNSFESGRNRHLKEVYGLLPTLLLLFAFPDSVNIIDRIERDILDKKDGKSAILMRDAICAKYVQVAVAVRLPAWTGYA